MSTVNNGGPAFPFEEKHTDGTHYHAHAGMTLRDYLAAKAMQACPMPQGHMHDVPVIYERIASHAYKMADAMLKVREVQQ